MLDPEYGVGFEGSHDLSGRLGAESVVWGERLVGRTRLGAHGQAGVTRLDRTPDPAHDAFLLHAHRFSVFVPAGCGRGDRLRRAPRFGPPSDSSSTSSAPPIEVSSGVTCDHLRPRIIATKVTTKPAHGPAAPMSNIALRVRGNVRIRMKAPKVPMNGNGHGPGMK